MLCQMDHHPMELPQKQLGRLKAQSFQHFGLSSMILVSCRSSTQARYKVSKRLRTGPAPPLISAPGMYMVYKDTGKIAIFLEKTKQAEMGNGSHAKSCA